MRSSSKAIVTLACVALAFTLLGRGLDRPATASNQPTDMTFAVVNTIGLLEQMLQGEAYQVARDETRASFDIQMQQLQTMNEATITILQNMDQNDPSYQMNVAQYQNQQAQMQQLGGAFGQELDILASQQATEIYAAISAAVTAVATREGFENVISNQPAPKSDLAIGLAGVTQQILARPMIHTNATDLTVAVREELGLPDPVVVAAEAAAAAQAAEAAALEAMLEAAAAAQTQPEAVEDNEAPADSDEGEEPAADEDGEG